MEGALAADVLCVDTCSCGMVAACRVFTKSLNIKQLGRFLHFWAQQCASKGLGASLQIERASSI